MIYQSKDSLVLVEKPPKNVESTDKKLKNILQTREGMKFYQTSMEIP